MGKKNKQEKRSQQRKKKASIDDDDDERMRNEDRFDTQHKPQFHQSSNKKQEDEQKVVLDERFASVLTDPKFQLHVRDKYGRQASKKDERKKTQQQQQELSAFYSIAKEKDDDDKEDDEKEESSDVKGEAGKREKGEGKLKTTFEKDDDDDEDNDDKEQDDGPQDPASRIAYLTALSRGELDVSSSSSSEEEDSEGEKESNDDDSNSDDDKEETKIYGKAGILDPSYQHPQDDDGDDEVLVELTFEPSPYLAVMNLAWDHVRAVDVFAIVSSFTRPGSVEKVQVYPSDFGMERMALEERFGPTDLWKKTKRNKKNQNLVVEQEEENSSENDSSSDEEENDNNKKEDRLLDPEKDDEGDSNSKDGESSNEENDVDEDEPEEDYGDYPLEDYLPQEDHVESDFDPEKLRAYEASRLKYYFAVVFFASAEHADQAYKEVDGLEMEHSSVAMDVRAIPADELEGVIRSRPVRDETTSLPSNYVPPEFVVNALQQTNVKCTWEEGDADRDRALTKYSTSGQDWKTLAEGDDLKAYLASDGSSDEEDNEEEGAKKKANMMRKMLGLDVDSADESDIERGNNKDVGSDDDDDDDMSSQASSQDQVLQDDDDDDQQSEEEGKQARFIPGAKDLAEKIRTKVQTGQAEQQTPWEKYQEKRKEKKKEKKRQAREKREEINRARRGGKKSNHYQSSDDDKEEESFFLSEKPQTSKNKEDEAPRKKIAKEELELLVAGDDQDEEDRNYDMRGLQRIDKNKDKKLRGARKRKEAQLAAGVAGANFQVDLQDDRFQALLEGRDERFGIDRTDPNFKDTPAMREVIAEQGRRRKKSKKRRKNSDTKEEKESSDAKGNSHVAPDIVAGSSTMSEGASALSSLVSRLKSKVQ